MMNRKEFVILIITTCFVIFIWIVADILHSQAIKPVNPKIQQLIIPLDSKFDAEVLNKLKEQSAAKQQIQTRALEQARTRPQTTPSEAPSIPPPASPSATPET